MGWTAAAPAARRTRRPSHLCPPIDGKVAASVTEVTLLVSNAWAWVTLSETVEKKSDAFFALTMGTGHESAANVNLASPALGLPSPLIRNGLLQASRCMRRTALTQATPPHFSAKARLLGATFLPPSQKSSALQFHPQSTNL